MTELFQLKYITDCMVYFVENELCKWVQWKPK